MERGLRGTEGLDEDRGMHNNNSRTNLMQNENELLWGCIVDGCSHPWKVFRSETAVVSHIWSAHGDATPEDFWTFTEDTHGRRTQVYLPPPPQDAPPQTICVQASRHRQTQHPIRSRRSRCFRSRSCVPSRSRSRSRSPRTTSRSLRMASDCELLNELENRMRRLRDRE